MQLRVALEGGAGEAFVAVTPLTELAFHVASNAGLMDVQNMVEANRLVSQLTGSHIIYSPPADTGDPEAFDAASYEAKHYGLILSGISQLMRDPEIGLNDNLEWLEADIEAWRH